MILWYNSIRQYLTLSGHVFLLHLFLLDYSNVLRCHCGLRFVISTISYDLNLCLRSIYIQKSVERISYKLQQASF